MLQERNFMQVIPGTVFFCQECECEHIASFSCCFHLVQAGDSAVVQLCCTRAW